MSRRLESLAVPFLAAASLASPLFSSPLSSPARSLSTSASASAAEIDADDELSLLSPLSSLSALTSLTSPTSLTLINSIPSITSISSISSINSIPSISSISSISCATDDTDEHPTTDVPSDAFDSSDAQLHAILQWSGFCSLRALLRAQYLSISSDSYLRQSPLDHSPIDGVSIDNVSANHIQLASSALDPPLSISLLTNLVSLYIEHAKIEVFPVGLLHLTSLERLSVSSNHIQSLPHNIGDLSQLKEFEIQYNQISKIPESITFMKSLKNFIVVGNPIEGLVRGISSLPCYQNNVELRRLPLLNPANGYWGWKELHDLEELVPEFSQVTFLTLSHNKIAALPLDFFLLSRVLTLDLSHNKVSMLPSALGRMTTLEYLSVAHNAICELPPEIDQLSRLMVLDVAYNQISQIPRVSELSALTSLIVEGNPVSLLCRAMCEALSSKEKALILESSELTDISDEFRCFPEFKGINLRGNKLAQVSSHICQKSCTSLDLSSNMMSSLPESLSLMTGLQRLNLSNNLFTSIPDLFMLTELTHFVVTNNPLSPVEQAIIESYDFTSRILKMTERSLNEIPQQITRLPAVEAIDFSFNSICEISNHVSSLQHLKSINVSNNHVKAVPSWISFLKSLSLIDVSFNQISESPDAHGIAKSIQLNLQGNPLPKGIVDFWQSFDPAALDLRFCSLKWSDFPNCLLQMRSLTSLDVSCNQISKLPESLGILENLCSLDISSNLISSLPLSFGSLVSLNHANLSGNPLTFPPAHVVQKGLGSIIDFLKGMQSDCVSWPKARILVFGDKGAGKTTLIKSLRRVKDPFKSTCKPLRHPTDGFHIYEVHLQASQRGAEIQADVWDFSGEHEYRFVYTYLLSPGNLVILVYNMATGALNSRLGEWASMVASVVSGTQVIVVATHADDPKFRNENIRLGEVANLRKVLSPFKDKIVVLAEVFVSNLTGRKIGHLRDLVCNTCAHLPNSFHMIPAAYLAAKDLASTQSREYVFPVHTFAGFQDLIQSISKKLKVDSILMFLRENGAVVWSNKSHLSSTVICCPRFFMRICQTLIHLLVRSGGLGACPSQDLLGFLDLHVPGYASRVVGIFRLYRFSFQTFDRRYEVFPSLLPDGEPTSDVWPLSVPLETKSQIVCKLTFNLLPSMLFAQIVCVLYSEVSFLLQRPSPVFYSSSSLVLPFSRSAEDQNASLVLMLRMLEGQRAILISVRSNMHSDAADSLRYVLSRIQLCVSAFEGIVIEARKILCPACMSRHQPLENCGQAEYSDVLHSRAREFYCSADGRSFDCAAWRGCWDSFRQENASAVIETLPTRLEFEMLDAYSSASEAIVMHLVCDSPFGRHRVSHMGYRIMPSTIMGSSVIGTFIRAVLADLKRLLSPDTAEDEKELEVKRYLQASPVPYVAQASSEYALFFKTIDLAGAWREHLAEYLFHNGHRRMLCSKCRRHAISENGFHLALPKLQGRMHYRTNNFYKGWEKRYFVLNKETRQLVRFKDAAMKEQTGSISLSSQFSVATWDTGDVSFGFKITVDNVVYFFKVNTKSEQAAWIQTLQYLSTGA
eukprot:TRINITY_DN5720_c0_g1_i1.p1 TRINITY_DN5720_c0_g1~~TRINITY_DN5720_c0_g1_i1.p1  ORF type:complete len:1556 (+),score=272.75 TRINITY_DN5720_c0_g1_i1:101-4768(+)